MSIRFPVKKGLYFRDKETPADFYPTSIEGFTQREVERAQVARKFYHDLNAELVENVNFLIQSNQARNVPITTECMNLAEKVSVWMYSTVRGNGQNRNQRLLVTKTRLSFRQSLTWLEEKWNLA